MNVDPVEELCRRVRAVPGDVETVVRDHVAAVAPLAADAERERLVRDAVARLAGLDSLADLLADPEVGEVLVNAGTQVWVERRGRLERAAPLAAGVLDVVLERILAPLGRRLDRTSPIVDARLPDGARVCAVVPPVAVDGACLSVRPVRTTAFGLDDFAEPPVVRLLHDLIRRRANVLVAGATSTGKTSLLAALVRLVGADERIVVLEDTAELAVDHPHLVRLEARPATADGVVAVPLHALVSAALRLRPDRLVVGEVRGEEVLALVQALNTGHDGSLATCHANGLIDALHRLETLVMQAAPTWPLAAVRSYLRRSIDAVVLVERDIGGRRRVAEVGELGTAEHGDGSTPLRPLVVAGSVVDTPRRVRA